MPTIIDSLVLELSLDPTKLTQGQQRAVASLRQLQNQAATSGKAVGSEVEKGLAALYINIDKHFRQANTSLTTIASQGMRTGASISAGAKEGAAGLSALTTSALAAYGALKGLQALYKSVTASSAAGAQIGRTGSDLGGGSATRTMQTLANAANYSTNADPNVVMENIRRIQNQLEAAKRTGDLGFLRDMQIAGVPINHVTDTWETVVSKLTTHLSGKTPQQASEQADKFGLDRNFGQFLRKGQGEVNAAQSHVQSRTLIDDQIESLTRLQRAERDVEQVTTKMWQAISADLSKHGLSAALEGIAAFTDDLSQNETKLRLVEGGVLAVAAAISISLVSALTKLAQVLLLPAFKVLGAASPLLTWLAGMSGGAAAAGAAGAFVPDSMLPEGASKARSNAWWGMIDWLHDKLAVKPEGGVAGKGRAGASSGSGGSDPRGLVTYIRSTAEKYGIDPDVAVRVAKSEGLGVFLGDSGKSGGAFQLYTGGGEGNIFQQQTGLNPLDPANEKATIDFALKTAANKGWGPWHGAARVGIGEWEGIKSGSYSRYSDLSVLGNDYGIVSSGPGAGSAYAKSLGRMSSEEKRRVAEGMATIKNSGGNWAQPNITVGDVTVNTQATDANGISKGLSDGIKRHITNQSNNFPAN